jgi:RNA recognition motif-containing protein
LEHGLTDRVLPFVIGLRVCLFDHRHTTQALTSPSIVEYATPEQAAQAITTLTNKELQGRVVYVREVSSKELYSQYTRLTWEQDREQEPRFGSGGGAPRGGGFGGGMGRGGFQGGFGGGHGGAPNAGRQLYISNVRNHDQILLC